MVEVFKYAVVHWYNYRKELSAGFIKGFNNLEKAKIYAFDLAYQDMIDYKTSDKVITEDEITDNNGPGKYGSPYASETIVGYGGKHDNGYCTKFYCVVDWFDGVTNDWSQYCDTNNDEDWYPGYGRSYSHVKRRRY
mmetsp:Transcript_11095/g.10030  ORF Transcript_11095/g.10030 Transcript_11095/m.10030 type:complete len:136 (+) Transcript_11095:117-524(+)